MALHTHTDFALLCGVSSQYISVNKKRNKIILSGDYVDDSIEPNISFIKKCLSKKKSGIEAEVKAEINNSETETYVPNISKPVKKIKTPNVFAPTKKDVERYEIESLKKAAEAQNIDLRNEILSQQLKKKLGETIPKDLTLFAFNSAFRSYTHNFKNAMEKHITRWAKHFTQVELAQARSEILKDINDAQHKAVAESKKSIAEIVAASSIKKEVGERE